MKNALIFFLIGAIAGAFAFRLYQHGESRVPAPSSPAPATAEPVAPASTAGIGDSLAQKLKEWKLTPADIQQDLAKTGEVVRSKTAEVGERLDDARVVAVIKAKYVLDSNLSALAISVECHDGEVTLGGTVKSAELIGRAVGLALDTHGVHNVVSRLKVAG
jgi:hyperosmotically inducible protein